MIGIYTRSTGGKLLADLTGRSTTIQMSYGANGAESAQVTARLSHNAAFSFYDRQGTLWLRMSDKGSPTVWLGRVEDVKIQGAVVQFTALGQWAALNDLPYTALWSGTKYDGFKVLTEVFANRSPKLFGFDTDNRIFIGLTKGSTYANGADYGSMTYLIPDGSSRLITGVQFAYELKAPSNWVARFVRWPGTTNTSGTADWTLTATGSVQSGVVHGVVSGSARIGFDLSNQTGASSSPSGESGTNYLKITEIRFVTSTANRVSTTLTATRNAGTNVTASVGSTANMYVGQRLFIKSAAPTNGEVVTVLSIGGPTSFNATFANNHGSSETVQAHVTYADEIVRDIHATTIAENVGQLLPATIIQSPLIDLTDVVYDDANSQTIISDLAFLGDASGRRWEAGVDEHLQLYFRPRSSQGRSWYVDVALSDLPIERSLSNVKNSVIAKYKATDGGDLRIAALEDAPSIARYGVTRQSVVSVDTSNAFVAALTQTTALYDTRDPEPRSGITVKAIYTRGGRKVPIHTPRPGDTITIRNLSPGMTPSGDKIRTFVLSRLAVDFIANTAQLEPLDPLPNMAFYLARRTVF